MVKILTTVCVFLAVCALYFNFRVDYLKNENTSLRSEKNGLWERVNKLEVTVKEKDNLIKIYAEAGKQAKEFEKELNNDITDNLNVVPANYILKQLQSD